MTDCELAQFLGIDPETEPKWEKVIASFSAERRALFERMANLEIEVALWQDGLGPKPEGVLIDLAKDKKRNRYWR